MHWKKLAPVLLLVAASCVAQPARPQNMTGVTVKGVVVSTAPPPPASGLTFSPPAGTYTGLGTQNVSITYSPSATGQYIFYTLDGSQPSAASKLYQPGSTIPVSATTTLSVQVENAGTVRQETQALALSNWKLCLPTLAPPNNNDPKYSRGTPKGVGCGGVGSIFPSTWSISVGSTMTMSISGTSGAPQYLFTLGGSGCDSCTKLTMDKLVQPVSGTNMENYEMDAWHNDGTRNRLVMGGLQCNQQSAFLQWQYDNEQGSWQNFVPAIRDRCPLPAGSYTHVIWELHWILGDTGCGGLGCTYYDALTINGVRHAFSPSLTLESDNPGWGSGCAAQDQDDLFSGGTPGSPKTAGRLVQHNNVTCSFNTITTGSATYTF